MTTLAESFQRYEADQEHQHTVRPLSVERRRAYMAGALDALTTKNITREQLLAEIVMYGRVVGSAVEAAA